MQYHVEYIEREYHGTRSFKPGSIKGLGRLKHTVTTKCPKIAHITNRDVRKPAGKTWRGVLLFSFQQVDFYEAGAGFAGVKLILPAGIAGPASAEHALAELRDRVGCAAEIAHVLREAVGVLYRRFSLPAHHRDLFPEIAEGEGCLTFWRFLSGPVLFPECQAVPPAMQGSSASRTRSSSVQQYVLHPV